MEWSPRILSADDYASIHKAGCALAARYGRVVTINAMLSAWTQFIEEIEDGFDAEYAFEYDHDLRCRDWLADAWPLLTETVRTLREGELRELDTRYLKATIGLEGVTVEGTEPGGGRWWHFRRPRRIERMEGSDLPSRW
ncbi:hypothetical protein ACFU3O_24295 [Streptomyces antibioticus]|uniref:hypothetical protein n=1 Tax=Streptomyces antibioticus TaxID=1890 RepID=UPI0036CFFDE1